jgi:hypothetical protein
MAEVVGERDRFRQIFIQGQRSRDRPADGRNFDRVRQARPQMVAGAVEKNLRLIFQPAKRARVNDPRPIALELGPIIVSFLRVLPAAGFAGLLGGRRQDARFVLFHLFAAFPARLVVSHAQIILLPASLCESGLAVF